MGLFDKLRKTLWQDLLAEGDRHRDAGDLSQALQAYASAMARFDGDDEERAALEERLERNRVRLRAELIQRAVRHANAREWDRADANLRAAFDRSRTDEERADIEKRQDRMLRYQTKKSGDMGKWLASGQRPKLTPNKRTPVVHYVVTRTHAYTINAYLEGFGHPLEGTVSVLPYDQLLVERSFDSGTYIFADVDRLNEHQRLLVGDIWDQLDNSDVEFRLFNHPLRVLNRYDLLRKLHREGPNLFDVYRITEIPRPLRQPVFLRLANDHRGPIGGPYKDDELDEAIAKVLMAGFPVPDLVAVEYCDTMSDDGLYRKYSAMRIGDRLLARHIQFGNSWMLKYNEVTEPDLLAEEAAYVRDNPHADELMALFDAADIQYGRIDYGIKNGAFQVWEINTNPFVMAPPSYYTADTMPNQEPFAVMALEAFEALAFGKYPRPSVDVDISPERIREVMNVPTWQRPSV